ncbi:lipoprotein NlpI [uncultured Shewanella sp.]|uniref:lipoprotein NlpI n=1 Tax=uncultured Shewanella sp. TaxID=173975 RepID=UPI0026129542|nr:lipoprotein NlpI [uncultured Shewanella sp.]
MNQKMRAAAVIAMMGMSFLLTACVSTADKVDSQTGRLLVAPVHPDYKLEITLAKLNEILAKAELSDAQRARFYYDRGVIYDRVGLRILARIDFMQALKIQPSLADAYNFLGIYDTQEGEYEAAYEAFDAALELEPSYEYAYLNRGIALYYGGRAQLATDDMELFYAANLKDGYRALWLYLAERKVDPIKAMTRMQHNRQHLANNAWSTILVDYYLGKVSKETVFADAKKGLTYPNEYAERLCEAYFYMAKMALVEGKTIDAANYFRLALATNIYDFIEYRYSRLELARIGEMLSKQAEKTEVGQQ